MADYKTILYQKQRNRRAYYSQPAQSVKRDERRVMDELDQALAEAETDPEIQSRRYHRRRRRISPPAKTSAARSRKPPGPMAFRKELRSTRPITNFAMPTARTFSARQLYRWQYPKPIIGAVSGWCFGAGSLAGAHLPRDDRRR